MTAKSKSSSVFRHRPQEARAETESSKPRNIVQGSVERTLGWFGRWRRLSKDYEELPEVSEAMVTLSMIRLMVHRLIHPNRKRLPGPMRLATGRPQQCRYR